MRRPARNHLTLSTGFQCIFQVKCVSNDAIRWRWFDTAKRRSTKSSSLRLDGTVRCTCAVKCHYHLQWSLWLRIRLNMTTSSSIYIARDLHAVAIIRACPRARHRARKCKLKCSWCLLSACPLCSVQSAIFLNGTSPTHHERRMVMATSTWKPVFAKRFDRRKLCKFSIDSRKWFSNIPPSARRRSGNVNWRRLFSNRQRSNIFLRSAIWIESFAFVPSFVNSKSMRNANDE